jgi:hypothetical protein
MKGRFPVDVFLILFGPFFVAAVALFIGSTLFSISQWSHRAIVTFALALAALALLSIFFLWRRYRRSRHT